MNKPQTGPLRLTKNEEHEGQYTITGAADTEHHSETYCHFGGYFGTYGPHVFLAAPELLAAASAAYEHISEGQQTITPVMLMLERAIHKASGVGNE
jgi:hypothetical protein